MTAQNTLERVREISRKIASHSACNGTTSISFAAKPLRQKQLTTGRPFVLAQLFAARRPAWRNATSPPSPWWCGNGISREQDILAER